MFVLCRVIFEETFHRALYHRAHRASASGGGFFEHILEVICYRTDKVHFMSLKSCVLHHVALEEGLESTQHHIVNLRHIDMLGYERRY